MPAPANRVQFAKKNLAQLCHKLPQLPFSPAVKSLPHSYFCHVAENFLWLYLTVLCSTYKLYPG